MDLLPPELHDVAILRRVLFAAVYLPRNLPDYWLAVTRFASLGGSSLHHESVKVAVENLEIINEKAFATDQQLSREIHTLRSASSNPHPLGIVLVSSRSHCTLCGGKLLIRNDRGSHIVVYTESFGTVVGTHYHKFCQKFRNGCSYRQYYGYSSQGSQSLVCYDDDWMDHQYFVSTSETAIEMSMLKKFDGELLLGQISYSQKAEIYNYCNGYPVHPKKCTTLEAHDLPQPRSVYKVCTVLLQHQRSTLNYHAHHSFKYTSETTLKCHCSISVM